MGILYNHSWPVYTRIAHVNARLANEGNDREENIERELDGNDEEIVGDNAGCENIVDSISKICVESEFTVRKGEVCALDRGLSGFSYHDKGLEWTCAMAI